MEDQIIRTQSSLTDSSGKSKNLVVAGFVLILALGITAGAYFLGQNSSKQEIAPKPSETPTQSPTPTESPVPSPTVSSTSVTPTKKLTATPTLTPTPVAKSKILTSTATLDGFCSSNNGGKNSLDIRAGRNSNLVTRGFVSFKLDDLPGSVQIVSATLRLYQASVTGNPYGIGGALKIDHLTYGDALDSTDYGLPALTSNIATLTSNATVEWKDADVTSSLKNDLSNARSASQYRLHFTTEVTGGNATGDFAYFDSANSYSGNTGHAPQLVVKYY